MGNHALLHPTEQTLSDFSLGKLGDGRAEVINNHLNECPDCQRLVAEMSSDSFLGRLRGAQGPTDKSAAAWSPEASSTAPDRAESIQRPPAETMPPGLSDHPDYEVIHELGRGGMGVVYLAHNRLMGRDEVLKVVSRHIMERPGVLARFLAEIRAVARLQHPNIVTAYSAFRLGESILFAMEYVQGLDLAKLVKTKGPLPVAHACYFVNQAAQGMQHAHEQGMVHRDIKPGNLMLSRKGDRSLVKILDFGLAKVTREVSVDGGLTNPGQALGTPDYIAPEQIRDAQKADIRADIYSLGCTLYYLLSGGPPFQAENLWDLYQAHHSMDAELLNFVRPEVPSELACLVAKMMAKEPERRFQTPAEVAQALAFFFKKGSASVRVSNAEISQSAQPEGKPESPAKSSVSTLPATNLAPGSATPLKKPAEKSHSNPQWESLNEFKKTEPEKEAAPASAAPRRPRPPWIWPTVAAGALLLGLVVAWAAGVFKVKTKDGVIVLENVPESAVVEVDGERITVTPAVGEPLKIEARPGKRVVVVKRGNDVFLGESVTVESGKQVKLTVRLESPASPDPRKTSPPPPAAEAPPGTGTPVADQRDEPTKTPSVPEVGRASSKAVETPPTEKKGGQAQAPPARAPMEELVRLPIYHVYNLAFSPDSKRVAVLGGWEYNETRYIELDTGRVLFVQTTPRPVIGVSNAFTSGSGIVGPDGNVVTSHGDQMVRVWDKSDGKAVRYFEPLPLGANFGNLRYCKQGDWVVGATMLDETHRDTQVRIWDYKSGKERKRYNPPSAIKSLDVHPEGKQIVSLHEDNIIRVWDALSGAPHVEFDALTHRVARVSFSPSGQQLLCLPQHPFQEFYLVGSENGKLIRTFKGPGTNVLDAAFFPRGLQVASVSAENILRVWSVATGSVLYFKQFDKDVSILGISPDGRYVVVIVPGETILYRWRPEDVHSSGLRTDPSANSAPKSAVAAAGSGGANTAPANAPAKPPVSKAPVSTAPPDSPEGRLNARGLTRSGAYFVLASEAEILERFEKVRPLIARMAEPFNMFAQALNNEMLLAGAEETHNELRAGVEAANAMLSKMPNGNRTNSEEKLEYQTAKAALDGLAQDRDNSSRVVDAMRAQQIPAERKAELVKDFNSKWSDFLKAANELTPLIDKTLGEYRKLQADPSVKEALAALRRSTKAAAILGPSKNLQNAHNAIKDAKRAYAPETAAPKKKTRPANAPATAAPKKKGQTAKR
jgi:serine/threonine protein kinase